ncbi:MAG: glycosyltransferase 87 family protein [Microbacteriaceae bacterium]
MLLDSRVALWCAFLVVHLVYGLVNLYSASNPFGDVRVVYPAWLDEALQAHYVVGIDGPWVYPVLALVPMFAARLFGADLYPNTWLSMILALDAIALGALTGWGRRGRSLAAGWWWTAFLAALGPIAIGRIDAVTVPIGIVALLFLARRPRLSAALLAIATWIKVWPAAIIGALLVASRHRLLVLGGALITSGLVIAIALVFGSGWNVLSFITEQTDRGLQIEAPVSTFWMWLAAAGHPGSYVYYDRTILTFQIAGRGTSVASALMNPVLAVAVVVVVLLAVRIVVRGRGDRIVPLVALALVATLIVFNKVGSPQYISWLAVPVVAAVAAGGRTRSDMRMPGRLVLLIAALTQLVYPYLYDYLVTAQPLLVVILTARNLLLVALFGLCLAELSRLGGRAGDPATVPDPLPDPVAEPAAWPFSPEAERPTR